MARNGTTCGDAVQAAVKSAATGVTAGTPVTDTQLKAIWRAAVGAMFTHDASNAVVASTITTAVVTSGAGAGGTVTGSALNTGGIT